MEENNDPIRLIFCFLDFAAPHQQSYDFTAFGDPCQKANFLHNWGIYFFPSALEAIFLLAFR